MAASISWDALSWSSARAATSGRRQEDFEALECLGAVQYCADLLDYPYRNHDDDASDFLVAVGTLLDDIEADRIVMPLATQTHDDHVLVRNATIAALGARQISEVYFYADLPYFVRLKSKRPAKEFNAELIRETPADEIEVAMKREAVEKYESQIPMLQRDFKRSFKSVFAPDVEKLYRRRTS
jgi:LmbE family N-acetylglucosaminyl deacetylase